MAMVAINTRQAVRHQVPRQFVVQALRHSAATRDQVDTADATFIGCFIRLWRVPWKNGYKVF
jgi:hypothetical protein